MAEPDSAGFLPARHHAELGDAFFDAVEPADFPKHLLRWRNDRWADRVGLGNLTESEWIAHFGRFEPLPGSLERPLALRYHGHQFRNYNPQLGDGRGFLFAQLRDPVDGRLLDLGTKGSGETPWSRGADGRLTLKGGIREVLATELLEARGVNTSKSFSLIETGENLFRGDEPSPTRSSVLVRLSHSHIRIGTFQRLAYLGDQDGLRRLVDHGIRHYMPEAWSEDEGARTLAFFERACANVARMGAEWTAAGFVHGVINTDNVTVTGESFDYGPYRFLPVYDPKFVAAYFDPVGLYAFGRQPNALRWNLCRLAECLLPFTSPAKLELAVNGFDALFAGALARATLDRLALEHGDPAADLDFVSALYGFMASSGVPFERFFFDWRGGPESERRAGESPVAELYAGADFAPVRAGLMERRPTPAANLSHAYFKGEPCTLLIEEIEALWAPIAQSDDWSAWHAKLREIATAADAFGTLIPGRS
ncbi:YdiU family protein [Skermanella mucosa]|uniref:protein adenylyltransferase SelO n=1 Tax=Skermanella mucosa TaxID=1789672 RepID=UPI00192BE75F|nr:YdiU family protein [Skermanella mucosa]UEM19607.1 YdiU family protein [Skermanella mucosa]